MLGQKIVDIDRFARNSLTPKPIASVRVKISSSVVDLAETAGPSSFGTSTSRITRSTSCSQLVTSAETTTADRCGFISKHDRRSHWHGAAGGRGRTLGEESASLSPGCSKLPSSGLPAKTWAIVSMPFSGIPSRHLKTFKPPVTAIRLKRVHRNHRVGAPRELAQAAFHPKISRSIKRRKPRPLMPLRQLRRRPRRAVST